MNLPKPLFKRLKVAIILMMTLFSIIPAQAKENDAHTFILVHGATGGGWDWKTVGDLLADQGHAVYRPTLTGLGEKHHLANDSVNLTTHITDVSNLILFEELENVILVGHSYGGMVITGVADRLPHRIKHLTFLDAAVPADGMSALDVWGTKFGDLNVVDGLVHFPWLENTDTLPRDVPHPANTLTEPVSFDDPDAIKINASYVAFVPENMSQEQRMSDPSWQRAESRGWTIRTFAGDHVVYRIKPKEFVNMLLETPKDSNRVIAE